MSHAALQFTSSTRVLSFNTVERPKITSEDHVLIRVAFAGICGTDLHIIHGEYPSKQGTFALGHEFSGVVDSVGAAVKHVKPGDHVAVDPNISCGVCDSCRNAACHYCKSNDAIGVFQDGGWAQFCVVPQNLVYRLPDSMPLEHGALCEPMSCVAHGWNKLAGVPHSSRVLILGAGIIGNLWACMFHMHGHRGNVTISEPQAARRHLVLALDLGYEVTTPDELARRDPQFDLVVDCSGSAAAMQKAFTWLNMGGRLMVFGVANPKATIAISPYDVMKKELSIIGALVNPHTFIEAVALVEMMGQRYLDYKRLGVKTFPLEAHEEAMNELEAGSIAKAVFDVLATK
ncbi:hypothetical protein B566_EDAN013530 [Ephemera danica]|nr:hypothetical protein B566_EDAN013530 [Ephemera danica]